MNRRQALAGLFTLALLGACDSPGLPRGGEGELDETGEPDNPDEHFPNRDALDEALSSVYGGTPWEGEFEGLASELETLLAELAELDPAKARLTVALLDEALLPSLLVTASILASPPADEFELLERLGEGVLGDTERIREAIEGVELGDETVADSVLDDLRESSRELRELADAKGLGEHPIVLQTSLELGRLAVEYRDRSASELMAEGLAELLSPPPPPSDCDRAAYMRDQQRAMQAQLRTYLSMMLTIMAIASLAAGNVLGLVLRGAVMALTIPTMFHSLEGMYRRAYVFMCEC